jgi:hypothetical protein
MTAIPAGNWSKCRGRPARGRRTEDVVTSPENGTIQVDLSEAARQLELAIHDSRVAFDCIALDKLDQAHTSVITARAAVDAAETILRTALATAPAPVTD